MTPTLKQVRTSIFAGIFALLATGPAAKAIEITGASLPGNQTLQIQTDTVSYQVDVRGTTEATDTIYPYLVYVTGTDIYGNTVYLPVESGDVTVRGQRETFVPASGAAATAVVGGGQVTGFVVTSGGANYSGNPVVTLLGGGGSNATAVSFINGGQVTSVVPNNPGSGYTSPPTVQFSGGGGATIQQTATTARIAGNWTVPNDGTLHNITSGYRLFVAIYNPGSSPTNVADLANNLAVSAQRSGRLDIDVLPDLAVGVPGSTYQAGRYRGADIIQFNNTWVNDSTGVDRRESRPLRSIPDDYYRADLRLSNNPEFGDANNDDFLLSRLVFAGDVPFIPNGTSIVRKVTVLDTPPAVPAYGDADPDNTALAGVAGTARDYTPQPDDGYLDIGERVTVSLEQLIPENYMGAYFVALRTTMIDEAEDASVNNTFVSNSANKIEILETASPTIEPASAVSTDNGTFVQNGDAASDFSSVSENGDLVAFSSRASNLLFLPNTGTGISTSGQQIFVKVRQTREVILASRDPNGVAANADCFNPAISANGRYVAFDSQATNLRPDPTGSRSMVYVFDTETFDTVIVSRSSLGELANGDCFNPQISQSGRFVVFESMARNLDPARPVPPTNPNQQVYLHDRDSDADGVFDEAGNTKTYLVSVNNAGGIANGWCANPVVNLEDTTAQLAANGGMLVAFTSYATNMPLGSGYAMVYRVAVDPPTGPSPTSVTAVSVNDLGAAPAAVGVNPVGAFIQPLADEAAINGDGSQIAFTSAANNFVFNPTDGTYTPTFPNNQPNDPLAPVDPAVLPAGDYNRVPDVFVRDFDAGTTVRVSVSQPRVATGTITVGTAAFKPSPPPGTPPGNVPVTQPLPGESININDGTSSVTLVFDTDVVIGATVFETRDNLVNAINAAGLNIVAYASNPPSVNPPGTAYIPSIFLRNLIPGDAGNRAIETDSTALVVAGMAGGGTQAEDDALAPGDTDVAPIQGVPFGSNQPSIDRSGRFVAFRSIATNLDVHVATDENTSPMIPPMPTRPALVATGELIRPLLFETSNVYRHDRQADSDPASGFDAPLNTTTERVSLNKFGYKTLIDFTQQSGLEATESANSSRPAISANGRFVSFSSDAFGEGGLVFGPNNLTPLDNVNVRDVFIRDQRSVGANPPAPATRPTITINAPQDNMRVPPGSTIGINASAEAKAGKTIASVQLFVNGVTFGPSLTAEPFSWQYTLPTTGTYSIRAVVTDSKGITASDSVNVVAAAPLNQGPTVSITQPSGVTTFVLGSEITLNVFASDPDGSIDPSSVKFFVNGTPLTAVPTGIADTYTATYRPPAVGTVTLSASATDDEDNTSVSVPLNLSFVPAARPLPAIEILDLLPGTPQPAGGQIPLRAEVNLAGASEEDVFVQFLANGSVVGTGTRQADGTYLLLWKTPQTPGAFTVSARVFAPGASVSQGDNEEGETYYYTALSSNFLTINTAKGVAPTVVLQLPSDGSTAGLNQALTLRAAAGASPGVSEVTLSSGGSGYASAPTVSFVGGGGTGATAVAVLGTGANAGKVVRVDVTDVGSGYTSVPTVTFSGGGGAGAAATAVVRTPTVASVQFYVNGQAIGAAIPGQPYETTFTPVSQGSYIFSAVATSTDGLKSQPDSVVVVVSGGQAPTVDITNPTTGVNYVPGTTIPVAATAEPKTPGARIASVQFFVDGISLGLPDTQAPYAADFAIPGAGPYKVTAVATDNFGNVGSKTVAINSTIPVGGSPVVSINYPTPSPLTLIPGSEIFINAAALAPTPRTIKEIRFYVDGVLVSQSGQALGSYRYRQSDNNAHSIVAEVVDSGDNASFSVPLVVRPQTFINFQGPSVTLEPIRGIPSSGVSQGTTLFLVAEAQVGNSTYVGQIDFYADGLYIGTVANTDKRQGPFSAVLPWAPTRSGSIKISAAVRGTKQDTITIVDGEASVTTVTDNYSVISSSQDLTVIPAANPPQIRFISPDDGAKFSPNSLLVAAVEPKVASGRSVQRVVFFVNGQPLPPVTQAPYTLSYTLGAIGSYSISAVVTDSSGQTGSEWVEISGGTTTRIPATINISAAAPTGSEPIVSITQPAPEANYVFGSVLPLNMSATDDIGIATNSTYFYLNGTPLKANRGFGNIYTGQYSVSSTTTALQLSASAKDNSNNTTVSGTLNFRFAQAQSIFPTVQALPLDASATAVAGGLVQLRAKANFPASVGTNSASSASRVEFFADNVFIGAATPNRNASTTNLYTHSLDWRTPQNTNAASYSITARAIDRSAVLRAGNGDTNQTDYYVSVFSPAPVPLNVSTNPPPSVSISQPATNNAPVQVGTASQIVAEVTGLATNASIAEVLFYLDGAFVASDTTSPYSYGFTPANAGLYNFAAVVIDSFGLQGSSTVRSVRATSGQAPTVTLTSPAAATTNVNVGQTVTLAADAKDTDGSITQVEFLVNGLVVDKDTTAPYSYNFVPSGPGRYDVLARATDNLGNIGDSAQKTIIAAFPAPVAPVVTITSPLEGQTFAPLARVSLAATVTSPADYPIRDVAFFINGQPVQTVTAEPYESSYQLPSTGNYTLKVVATDVFGNLQSAERVIKCRQGSGAGPVVTLNLPPTNTNSFLVEGSQIYFNAVATDTDGFVSNVRFYVNNTEVTGPVTRSGNAWAVAWQVPAPNQTYLIHASATDNLGNTAVSSSATVLTAPRENALPVVNLLGLPQPAPGEPVLLQANAVFPTSTPLGRKVDFFVNGVFIGAGATAGGGIYSFAWTPTAGTSVSQVSAVASAVNFSSGGSFVGSTIGASVVPPTAPVIDSPAVWNAGIGVQNTYQITALNGPLVSFTAELSNGAPLPSWMSLDTDTGLLTATPPQAANLELRVTATNIAGVQSQPYLVQFAALSLPVITSSPTWLMTVNANNTYQITSSVAGAVFQIQGQQPSWIESFNPTTGLITARSTVPIGETTIQLVATGAAGPGPVFNLVASAPAPTITGPSSVLAPANAAATTVTMQANNSPTAWTKVSGPDWVTIGAATGVVTLQPPTPGTYQAVFVASNSFGPSPAFTLNITAMFAPAVPNGPVAALAADPQGQFLFVGGQFNRVTTRTNGVPVVMTARNIAKLNAQTGQAVSGFSGNPGGEVLAMAYRAADATGGPWVYVAGRFETVSTNFGVVSTNVSLVKRLDAATGLADASFAPDLLGNNSISEARAFTLAFAPGGQLVVGGTFSGALKVVTTGPSPVVTTPALLDGAVQAIAVDESKRKIVIGGYFAQVNGRNFGGLARLNENFSVDTTFSTGSDSSVGFNGVVNAIALDPVNELIYAGGVFSSYSGRNFRQNLVALDYSGTLQGDFNFQPGLNDAVNSLVSLPQKNVLVGGAFTKIGNILLPDPNPQAVGRLVQMVSPAGSINTAFNPGGAGAENNSVMALLRLPSGNIAVGGSFTTFNGDSSLSHLAIISGVPTTAAATPPLAPAPQPVPSPTPTVPVLAEVPPIVSVPQPSPLPTTPAPTPVPVSPQPAPVSSSEQEKPAANSPGSTTAGAAVPAVPEAVQTMTATPGTPVVSVAKRAAGSYVGIIASHPTNNRKGAAVSVSVAADGKVSGQLSVNGTNRKLVGTVNGKGVLAAKTMRSRGQPDYSLALTFTDRKKGSAAGFSGRLASGRSKVPVTLMSSPWSKVQPARSYQGTYNIVLNNAAPSAGGRTAGSGGSAVLTVGPDGSARLTARLANRRSFTWSGRLAADGSLHLSTVIGAKGVATGTLRINASQRSVGGSLLWIEDASHNVPERRENLKARGGIAPPARKVSLRVSREKKFIESLAPRSVLMNVPAARDLAALHGSSPALPPPLADLLRACPRSSGALLI